MYPLIFIKILFPKYWMIFKWKKKGTEWIPDASLSNFRPVQNMLGLTPSSLPGHDKLPRLDYNKNKCKDIKALAKDDDPVKISPANSSQIS